MRIGMVHNEYGAFSGEEAVVRDATRMLGERGHTVVAFTRSSADIPRLRWGKAQAFVSGIYSREAVRAVRAFVAEQRLDVAHIHNVYPLISGAVLPAIRRLGVPIVMTTHNYRLICPNGLLFSHGELCERCVGGREYWCVLRNCEEDWFKSFGYALRGFVGRRAAFFTDNISRFACLSAFQKERLIAAGLPERRLAIVPNPVPTMLMDPEPADGEYVAYVGRISREKGVATLMEAARRLPEVPFRVAGRVRDEAALGGPPPPNVVFVGHLARPALADFYDGARMVVVPSVCYEGFAVVAAEAMAHARPVVASRLGAFPELVDEGLTGQLFAAGDAAELARSVAELWARPDLCRAMGGAGYAKVRREYTRDQWCQRMIAVYEDAIRDPIC